MGDTIFKYRSTASISEHFKKLSLYIRDMKTSGFAGLQIKMLSLSYSRNMCFMLDALITGISGLLQKLCVFKLFQSLFESSSTHSISQSRQRLPTNLSLLWMIKNFYGYLKSWMSVILGSLDCIHLLRTEIHSKHSETQKRKLDTNLLRKEIRTTV